MVNKNGKRPISKHITVLMPCTAHVAIKVITYNNKMSDPIPNSKINRN